MTDISGIPVIAPVAAATPGIAIAQVPITLEPGQSSFEISLREPGIVRACMFWLHTPKVLASTMRGMSSSPQPLLFVECKTDGELRRRRFVWAPSDAVVGTMDGHAAKYLATAVLQAQAGALTAHLFEVVELGS